MIYIEKTALNSPVGQHVSANHDIIVVDSMGEVPNAKSEILIKHKHDVQCHPCPATRGHCCCNYYNTDVMEGCPYDCSYCILQSYLDHKNIHISADTAPLENALKELIASGVKRRVGTGELSDSLALDYLYPYSKIITPIINKQDVVQFEFKTKSANIDNLLNLNPANIVVAWSVNPQCVIDMEEHGTASLLNRLNAAKLCAEAGYRVAFHFDPIIYSQDYAKRYSELMEMIANTVPERCIEYISISTLRATKQLIDKIRERTVPSVILQGDFVHGLDGKVRYFKNVRTEMMQHVAKFFQKHMPSVFLYLCMEHETVWQKVLGVHPAKGFTSDDEVREGVESLFPWYK